MQKFWFVVKPKITACFLPYLPYIKRWCSIRLRRTKLLHGFAVPALLQGCTIERATPNCQIRRIRDPFANNAAKAQNNAAHHRPNAIYSLIFIVLVFIGRCARWHGHYCLFAFYVPLVRQT